MVKVNIDELDFRFCPVKVAIETGIWTLKIERRQPWFDISSGNWLR